MKGYKYWKSKRYTEYLAKRKKLKENIRQKNLENQELKIHFKFITQNKDTVYLCNWATSNPSRFAKNDKEVTCKNCLRIMKNYMIKNTGRKK